MQEPRSIHPESVSGYGQSKADDRPALARRQTVVLAVAALLTLALAAAAVATIVLLPPAPMAVEAAPTAPAPTAPAPSPAAAAPAPAPAEIAVGFTPGARDQRIPAGAELAHLGPVEWVSGQTECLVQFQDAQVWGSCAELGFPDAPPPTPIPTSRPAPPPAPRPAYQAPAAAPAEPPAVMLPTEDPLQSKPKPARERP